MIENIFIKIKQKYKRFIQHTEVTHSRINPLIGQIHFVFLIIFFLEFLKFIILSVRSSHFLISFLFDITLMDMLYYNA